MNSHRVSGMISLRTTAIVIAAAAVAAIAFAQLSTTGLDKAAHRAGAGSTTEVTVLDAEYPSKSYYYLPDQHTLHADAKKGNAKTYERD